MIQGLVPLNNWLTTGLETQQVAVVDKVGLFPWLSWQWWFLLLDPDEYDFPFFAEVSGHDSLWLGNFLPKWCKDAKHVQAPSANGQRDTSCFCLPLWSMLQIRLHFFFWRLGTRLTLSCVCQCFDVVGHTVCETPLFLKSALPISKLFSEIVLCPFAMSFWFILPSALFVVMINGRVLLKAGFLFCRENRLFGKWVSLSISAWLASKLLCLWEHAAFLYSASLYDFRNYTTAS